MTDTEEQPRELAATWQQQHAMSWLHFNAAGDDLLAALDSTDPVEAAPRTSVPLKDLIEEEAARSPEFAAGVEATNRALDDRTAENLESSE